MTEAASVVNRQSSGLSPRALAWLLDIAGVGCCVAVSVPKVHIVSYCVDLTMALRWPRDAVADVAGRRRVTLVVGAAGRSAWTRENAAARISVASRRFGALSAVVWANG